MYVKRRGVLKQVSTVLCTNLMHYMYKIKYMKLY